jgi:hypothetical protein
MVAERPKVSVVSLPLILVAEVWTLTSRSKLATGQLIEPATVDQTAAEDVVFVTVVEPEIGTFPGSRRRCVAAEAETEPKARRPNAAAVSETRLRLDMNSPSCTECT